MTNLNKMTLPYIRIDYGESIEQRRKILSSEINLINLVKRINNFKKLRRQEFLEKLALRTLMRKNILKINMLMKDLPEVEIPKISMRERKIEIKKKSHLDEELAEIREKLSKL